MEHEEEIEWVVRTKRGDISCDNEAQAREVAKGGGTVGRNVWVDGECVRREDV